MTETVYQRSLEELKARLADTYTQAGLNSCEEQPRERGQVNMSPEERRRVLIGIIRLVEQKYYRDPSVSLALWAFMLKTNRTYISYLLNEEFGMSIRTFVNTLRVRDVQEYLLAQQPPYPVQQQYFRWFGFCDPSSMIRAFLRVTGCTPTEWLEKQQTAEICTDEKKDNKLIIKPLLA